MYAYFWWHVSVTIAFYIFPEITDQNNSGFHKSRSKCVPGTNETVQEIIIFKFIDRIYYWTTKKLRNGGLAVRINAQEIIVSPTSLQNWFPRRRFWMWCIFYHSKTVLKVWLLYADPNAYSFMVNEASKKNKDVHIWYLSVGFPGQSKMCKRGSRGVISREC